MIPYGKRRPVALRWVPIKSYIYAPLTFLDPEGGSQSATLVLVFTLRRVCLYDVRGCSCDVFNLSLCCSAFLVHAFVCVDVVSALYVSEMAWATDRQQSTVCVFAVCRAAPTRRVADLDRSSGRIFVAFFVAHEKAKIVYFGTW